MRMQKGSLFQCGFTGLDLLSPPGGLKLLAFTGVDPAAAEKFQRIQCRVVIEGGQNW